MVAKTIFGCTQTFTQRAAIVAYLRLDEIDVFTLRVRLMCDPKRDLIERLLEVENFDDAIRIEAMEAIVRHDRGLAAKIRAFDAEQPVRQAFDENLAFAIALDKEAGADAAAETRWREPRQDLRFANKPKLREARLLAIHAFLVCNRFLADVKSIDERRTDARRRHVGAHAHNRAIGVENGADLASILKIFDCKCR